MHRARARPRNTRRESPDCLPSAHGRGTIWLGNAADRGIRGHALACWSACRWPNDDWMAEKPGSLPRVAVLVRCMAAGESVCLYRACLRRIRLRTGMRTLSQSATATTYYVVVGNNRRRGRAGAEIGQAVRTRRRRAADEVHSLQDGQNGACRRPRARVRVMCITRGYLVVLQSLGRVSS